MKILLTGCLGFIGSNTVPKLLNSGHSIVGFDNRSNTSIKPTDRMKLESGPNWDNFKFYDCDIRNIQMMHTICANEKPEAIIHLAALGSVPRSFNTPNEVVSVNEYGFTNIMMLAAQLQIKKVVFASSSSVYGNSPYSKKTEGAEGMPLSPYALTKAHNEMFAKIWALSTDINYVGLRFFNVYGPGQNFNSSYSAVIPRFINSNKITIYGNGEITRDFTYVDDVASAISLAMNVDGRNIVCNIGTGLPTTLNELAKIISNGEKQIERIEGRLLDIPNSVADISKAKEVLGYEPQINIKSGIEKTISYYKSINEQQVL